ncbi:MAG: alpha/beta fold hydrolase, partial [Eggerthellaceae bacterium]|nr:alpha/beta fold hydrolase [Eggerthellaceae bacterium]
MIEKPVVVGEGTKYPLKALVTLPDNIDEPVPAVVFVHGSGSSNMDEQVGKLTPFRDLAEGLAQHGIASIRYDKRSFSHAREMMRNLGSSMTVKEETVEDAILASEILRQDPQIDPEKIFIVGHSRGGMLAPRIDAEGGNFRGLVIMAGTLRKLEEVLVGQNEEVAKEMGGLVRWIVSRQVVKLKKLFTGLYDLSDEEAKAKKAGGGTTLYYFKEMGQNLMPDY